MYVCMYVGTHAYTCVFYAHCTQLWIDRWINPSADKTASHRYVRR